jgi:chemosensory pili system protein ChpA (sensor histidine kinase/response regulator)
VFNTPLAKLTAAAALKKSARPPSVMVVDDSLTVRKVTCRLLEREGCEILIAKNGKEAAEILRETVPDVMLIDLEMPKMNGFELIRHVRANPETAKIPIIIISSRTAEKHRKIASDLGVSVFLGKPYKEEELLNHLAQLGLNRAS